MILLAAVACALSGVRRIRAGQVRAHRRRMLAAGSLVLLFLLSYVVKVITLGREDRSEWSAFDHTTLYVHEAGIAVMLAAAGYALTRAARFRAGLGEGALEAMPGEFAGERARHRRSGRVAVAAAVLALFTAALVLAGMYGRAWGH